MSDLELCSFSLIQHLAGHTVRPFLSFLDTFTLSLANRCNELFVDMYMSYRWCESFNTVRLPSDSWRHHNGDWHVWVQNAERRGGEGWTIHPLRRWLISCAWTMMLYVCLSIALTSCTTCMAETNLESIRKQKNAEYSKRYRWKRKIKMQQQAPTTPEAEPEKLQL